MTKPQLAQLHIYRQKLTTLSGGHFDRPAFDLVLLNLGRVQPADGVVSSKGLTNGGFERVMAFLEDRIAQCDPKIGTYWRDRDHRRGHYLTTRQEWQIGELYQQLTDLGLTYRLDSIVGTMTNNRTRAVYEMNPAEAAKVIEMLKAAIARQPRTVQEAL